MKRGYTLVELLVVLGIVALLAALLFPVIAEARERGRAPKCLSNLRQLTQSTLMYLPDWDDYYPLAGYFSTNPEGQPCFLTLYHEIEPYVKDARILNCPSDGAPTDVFRLVEQRFRLCPARGFRLTSYMANWCVFELGDLPRVVGRNEFHPPISHAQIPFPPETALFFDSVIGTDLLPYVQGRHQGGFHASFADGSARKMKARQGYGTVSRGDGSTAPQYCILEVGAYYDGGQFCEAVLMGIADRRVDGRACYRCPNRPNGGFDTCR